MQWAFKTTEAGYVAELSMLGTRYIFVASPVVPSRENMVCALDLLIHTINTGANQIHNPTEELPK